MKIYSFLFTCLFLCGCIGKTTRDCSPNFWKTYVSENHHTWKDSLLYIKGTAKLDSLGITGRQECVYEGSISLFKQRQDASPTSTIETLQINGYFCERFNRIYLITQPQNEKWLLFDFNMDKGDRKTVIHPQHNQWLYYENKTINPQITYELSCENKLYMSDFSENIYTFRFKDFSVPGIYCGDKIDWVFYVGKNVGVLGSYIGSIGRDGEETLYTHYYIKKIGTVFDKVVKDDRVCL